MINFAFRQFRAQAAVSLVGLVIVAVVAGVTGPHLVHLYDSTVANCAKYRDCATANGLFLNQDSTLRHALNVLVIVVPCIIGVFWGAPLIARELEAGTFRLAWTQSISRSRWLVSKVGLVGLASMAVVGLLSLMVTWWSSPFDSANMSLYNTFDERGIVPIGYAAFAFALGITAGAVMRRTLPAMATTLVTFVVARVAIFHWIRPHLLAPLQLTSAIKSRSIGFGIVNGGPVTLFPNTPNIQNAWIYSAQFVDKANHPITPGVIAKECPTLAHLGPPTGPSPTGGLQTALQNCTANIGTTYHVLVQYQPSRHYWPMQWIELGIYLALAIGLAGLCYWWVQRRLA
jgi:ABC-type transport system involved in multi-copper enzyme maturation permease subunit